MTSIARGIYNFTHNKFALNISKIIHRYPDANINDALSSNQCDSKRWLVDHLKEYDPMNVFIMGGWYGTLAYMMLREFDVNVLRMIRSIDIDPSCAPIADLLNRDDVVDNWRFKAVTANMMDITLPTAVYDVTKYDGTVQNCSDHVNTLINTSCEHMTPDDFVLWLSKIPIGTFMVLQSNNYYLGDGHVNCVNSLTEFEDQVNLTHLDKSEELVFPEYTRYMLIGYK